MELKPLKTLQSLAQPLNRVMDFVSEWTNQFKALFLTGQSFDVTINTTDTVIDHGLGIVPNGWFLLDKQANTDVWRVSWTNRQIVLRASAQVTIKLWVF